ncbi:unnamed protein product, partial [Pylaiella littoralis]
PVGAYGQCGGKYHGGSTCCADGYQCEVSDEFYSQCRPEQYETSNPTTPEGDSPSPAPTTAESGDDHYQPPTQQPQQTQ